MSEYPSHFFPEKMEYVEIVCPIESCYNVIKKIAEKGTLEVIDCNKNMQEPRRHLETFMICDDADRNIRFIETHLKSIDGLFPPPPLPSQIGIMINDLNLAQIADRLRQDSNELREKIKLTDDLKKQLNYNQKKMHALRFFKPIVQQETRNLNAKSASVDSLELEMIQDPNPILLSITGMVPTDQLHKLLRTVYRISRRNAIFHVGEASSDNIIPYAIFVSAKVLQQKLQKICESFSSDVFTFDCDTDNLNELEQQVATDIQQGQEVLDQADRANQDFLIELSHEYWAYRIFVTREKQIWLTVDYGDFDMIESSAIYRAWTPKRLSKTLYQDLQAAAVESGTPIPIQIDITQPSDHPELTVPTFIEKNDFTRSFQNLNNAYGIPNYDEINGGAFYSMYPFLFGVMFGDIGHSIFYILASITLLVLAPIAKKKRWDFGDIGNSVFNFKWFLFFCSICAFYCGFIYNECFGLPFSTFSSNWEIGTQTDVLTTWKQKEDTKIYPFGIDYIWYFKDNELIFLNSYKMKLAVILGMSQMVFGMFLQLINHIYRKDAVSIILWWIPEMMYLIPFFGYMVVIIIMKWCTKFQGNSFFLPDQQEDGVNLIQMLIGLVINAGSKDQSLQLYSNQWNVQTIILVLFIISIVLLLFARPVYFCIAKRKDPNFNMIEGFVMNLIEVIEFCLGALSHTASYLRLWALSLAHSQLSHVIYDELFILTVNTNNVFFVFIGFAAFCCMTAAILLGMEAFSALLHAIRLMWVEFSSKFYSGMGVGFKPVSFTKELKKIGVTQ